MSDNTNYDPDKLPVEISKHHKSIIDCLDGIERNFIIQGNRLHQINLDVKVYDSSILGFVSEHFRSPYFGFNLDKGGFFPYNMESYFHLEHIKIELDRIYSLYSVP